MKTKCVLIVIAASLATAFATSAFAEGFRVRIGLVNGHLKEVFFGCEEGATSGYDRSLDDLAPPPGIQTGYTAFETPVVNMPKFFYKDIRGLDKEVTWKFYAEVFPKKPVTVSWDPADLPEAHEFVLSGAGFSGSMRERSSVTVESTDTLMIKMTPRKTAAAPSATPAPTTEQKASLPSQEAAEGGSPSRVSILVVLALVLGAAVIVGFITTR